MANDKGFLTEVRVGDLVRITTKGKTVEGTVLSAVNYGERDYEQTPPKFTSDDWYVRIDDGEMVHYWKQGIDGGSIGILAGEGWNENAILKKNGIAVDGMSVKIGNVTVHSEQLVTSVKLFTSRYMQIGDNMWISKETKIDDVFSATGYKSYDLALPQDWVAKTYWAKGYGTPQGCWCYDKNEIFGEFVPLTKAFEKLVEMVKAARKAINEAERNFESVRGK